MTRVSICGITTISLDMRCVQFYLSKVENRKETKRLIEDDLRDDPKLPLICRCSITFTPIVSSKGPVTLI